MTDLELETVEYQDSKASAAGDGVSVVLDCQCSDPLTD